jgi:hypothetical protein
MHTIEVWVVVDQNGDFDCGADADNASERYGDSIGGDLAGSRVVKMTLQIEMPEPLTISATLPAREGKVSMTVAG